MYKSITTSVLCICFTMSIFFAMPNIARALTTLDTNFKPVLSTAGTVTGIAPLPNGKEMVIGDFTSINGVGCKRIARLNPDGSVDTSFQMTTEFMVDRIDAIAVQSDGKIIIGGYLTYYGVTESQTYLFRLNTDGSWDKTFTAGGYIYSSQTTYGVNNLVKVINVDSNDKILIGGDFTQPKSHIARLNSDGSADGTFDPGTGADGIVTHISRQSNGIIIGGGFSNVNGTAKAMIARLGINGALDTSAFGTGLYGGSLQALAVQADDKILIGGTFFMLNGATVPKLIRTTAAGALDGTFTQVVQYINGNGETITTNVANYFHAITSLLALPDKIIVGGWNPIMYFGGTPTDHNAQIYVIQGTDGAFVGYTQFKGKPTDVWALAKRSDGVAIAGGSFTQLDDGTDAYYPGLCLLTGLYYRPDTVFRPIFNPIVGGQGDVGALAIQADGKIIAGGSFSLVDGVGKNGVARINANGTLDATLSTPATLGGAVTGVLVRGDGKLVMGGSFYNIAGQDYKDVALLSSTGVMEAGAYVGGVSALSWYPENKVLAVMPHSPGIRRLNSNLTLEDVSTFNPGTGISNSQQPDYEFDRANAVAVQNDGKILVGGSFFSFSGATRQNIVRLNADGSLDAGFSSPIFTVYNFRSEVFSIAIQSDGKILIVGRFSTVNGIATPTVARLNPNGTVDTSFQTPFGDTGSSAYKVYVQDDGKILVGGSIQIVESSVAGNIAYNSLVRLNPDGSRDSSFNFSLTSATNGGVRSILVAPTLEGGGQILVGGAIEAVDGVARFGIARFLTPAQQFGLIVTKTGTGNGNVTADPGTIAWNNAVGTALYDKTALQVVILSASASPGSTFSGWSGEGCSGTGTCTVTMSSARYVTASFIRNSYQLTIDTAQSNSTGNVVSTSPVSPVISCPTACSDSFSADAVVSLTAFPAWHSYVSWGNCSVDANNGKLCTVTMNADKTVTAAFYIVTNRVLIVSDKGYDSLVAAKEKVSKDCTIMARESSAAPFQEDILFDKNYTVTFDGGKDASWVSIPGGYTSIKGSLKISKGKVIVNGIKISL